MYYKQNIISGITGSPSFGYVCLLMHIVLSPIDGLFCVAGVDGPHFVNKMDVKRCIKAFNQPLLGEITSGGNALPATLDLKYPKKRSKKLYHAYFGTRHNDMAGALIVD